VEKMCAIKNIFNEIEQMLKNILFHFIIKNQQWFKELPSSKW